MPSRCAFLPLIVPVLLRIIYVQNHVKDRKRFRRDGSGKRHAHYVVLLPVVLHVWQLHQQSVQHQAQELVQLVYIDISSRVTFMSCHLCSILIRAGAQSPDHYLREKRNEKGPGGSAPTAVSSCTPGVLSGWNLRGGGASVFQSSSILGNCEDLEGDGRPLVVSSAPSCLLWVCLCVLIFRVLYLHSSSL